MQYSVFHVHLPHLLFSLLFLCLMLSEETLETTSNFYCIFKKKKKKEKSERHFLPEWSNISLRQNIWKTCRDAILPLFVCFVWTKTQKECLQVWARSDCCSRRSCNYTKRTFLIIHSSSTDHRSYICFDNWEIKLQICKVQFMSAFTQDSPLWLAWEHRRILHLQLVWFTFTLPFWKETKPPAQESMPFSQSVYNRAVLLK